VPVWHEDVMFYDVDDAAHGRAHRAASISISIPRRQSTSIRRVAGLRRVARRRKPSSVRFPISYPFGLTHSELERCCTSFGHVMARVLFRRTEVYNHTPARAWARFCRGASAMYEEWATMESLVLMRNHWPTADDDESLRQRISRPAKKIGSFVD